MLRLPFHATDALAGFFASAESDAGMRSTFGAFVALAQSGVRTDGGVRDPEVNVTDERLLRIGRGREVWRALRRLPGETQCVLYAAHGPTDWAKLVDASFGRGTATKVMKLVGPHLGVALLTPTVVKGLAAELASAEPVTVSNTLCEGRAERRRFVEVEDPETKEVTRAVDVTPSLPRIVLAVHEGGPTKRVVERTALWNTTGGWLVATSRAEAKAVDIAKVNERVAASPLCSRVRGEAAHLLRDAEAAYADAHNATLTRSGHRIELVHVAEAEAPPKPARASRAGVPKALRERVARVTGAEVEAWA